MNAAEVREHVRAGGLLPERCFRDGAGVTDGSGTVRDGGGVVAMLSGGRDSVCLLDICAALCGAERVHALHVNYGLRAESDEDERHCRALCERLGVEIEVVRARRDEGTTGNLHAWARALRYGAARELAKALEQGVDGVSKRPVPRARGGQPFLIATGHTATDQVETIL